MLIIVIVIIVFLSDYWKIKNKEIIKRNVNNIMENKVWKYDVDIDV